MGEIRKEVWVNHLDSHPQEVDILKPFLKTNGSHMSYDIWMPVWKVPDSYLLMLLNGMFIWYRTNSHYPF
jgi:hypothetical protein